MEAFALLRYWSTTAGTTGDSVRRRIATKPAGYESDGPYIDLYFTSDSTETESDSGIDDVSQNGDDLRFSFCSDESEYQIVKSGTEFRVLLLDLKKSKSDSNWIPEKDEKSELAEIEAKGENQGRARGKMLRVKFDGKSPPVSLFARDESNYGEGFKQKLETNSASDERNLGKEMSQKYLNMVKPLYVRVSSRFVEKMKVSGDCTPRKAAKGRSGVKRSNNLQALVNVMRDHLVKIRSTTPSKNNVHAMMRGTLLMA